MCLRFGTVIIHNVDTILLFLPAFDPDNNKKMAERN